MKTAILACAGLLALAGCSSPPPPPPPPAVASGDCPNKGPGTLFGPMAMTAVTDQIDNSAADDQPLSLKLQYAAGLGVCVDGGDGEIHIYGDKAGGAQFTLTFAPGLAGKATWPTDATQAIQIADKPDGPFAAPPATSWNPPPAVMGGGTILMFTVPSEPGRTYYYRLQYLDSTGAPETVDSKIINYTPPPPKS
ncbi:MAG TPA: hypothetical protein VGF42_04755 [Caulobacteraceae bacterium]